jgi:hypothetical protein
MYTDNTLTPREAVRLCALGTLAGQTMSYDDLVFSVRHFVSRITGPSLELMGESIELLRFEGLIEPQDGAESDLIVTPAGHDALVTLLSANIRSGSSDVNELVMALKFRFLHILDTVEQRSQTDLFLEACETELARLEDLRNHHEADGGYLTGWLDLDIQRLEVRLTWLEAFKEGLGDS